MKKGATNTKKPNGYCPWDNYKSMLWDNHFIHLPLLKGDHWRGATIASKTRFLIEKEGN